MLDSILLQEDIKYLSQGIAELDVRLMAIEKKSSELQEEIKQKFNTTDRLLSLLAEKIKDSDDLLNTSKKRYWVNIFMTSGGIIYADTEVFESYEAARDGARRDRSHSHITTISFEN